jgi:hypothetical protein
MKQLLIVLLIGMALIAQSKSRPQGVPTGATVVEEGVWRWVDPKGKAWIYRQSPVGVMRAEEEKREVSDARKVQEDEVLKLMSVKEEGDLLRFERIGPFGTYKWAKKKSEPLSKEEAAVWDRARAAKAGALKK